GEREISPRQLEQTMITSPPAQLDRLMERQRPGHRPTAMAAGCFGGLPWAGLQLRLMTLAALQYSEMINLQPFELVDVLHLYDHICSIDGGNLSKRFFILKVKNRHLFFLHDE
ncbi:hypothetical protein QU755_12960, partial [Pseudomonas wenzhouensis]